MSLYEVWLIGWNLLPEWLWIIIILGVSAIATIIAYKFRFLG